MQVIIPFSANVLVTRKQSFKNLSFSEYDQSINEYNEKFDYRTQFFSNRLKETGIGSNSFKQ